ncbi:MAG TPA: 2-oxo-4-hydroxy-4-carboxy-5-ureidoimidazoline decarboxylase [Actinomycetes bacterium]|nr:2-oxo-4-hydroxy-4-carboxy-5-ureidoimidazoline decarboxylase [Actinomycetes bacterium]
MDEGIGLDGFNALPAEQARTVLLACCAAPRWAERLTRGRPYRTPEQLFEVADEVLADLDDLALLEAVAAHPRIGAPLPAPAGGSQRSADWSSHEQSAVADADESTLAALAEGNRRYEQRFGHVYLVAAGGRTADELLALLHTRLANDPATERRVLRGELAAINRARLARVVGP